MNLTEYYRVTKDRVVLENAIEVALRDAEHWRTVGDYQSVTTALYRALELHKRLLVLAREEERRSA